MRTTKSPRWYVRIHKWVRREKKVPKRCQDCKKIKPLDAANKSGKYLKDLGDWEYLCRNCHMSKDGRKKWLASIAGEATKKPVIQRDLKSGRILKRWPYMKEAALSLGVHYSNISRCVNGHTKSSAGFAWSYGK